MLLLDSTLRKLQFQGDTGTNCDFFVSFVEEAFQTANVFTPGTSKGNVAVTTATDILAAPSSGDVRQVRYLSLFNTTASTTNVYTVLYNDNGTTRTLYRGSIAAGQMVEYVDGEGWHVVDASGNRKFTSTAASSISIKHFENWPIQTMVSVNQGTLFLQQFDFADNFSPDVGVVGLAMRSQSSGDGATVTIAMGVYSANGATLSLASSTTRTLGYNSTAAASSASAATGSKFWTVPTGTWNLTPGAWWLGIGFSVSTSSLSGSFSYFINQATLSVNGSEFGGGTGNVTSPVMFGVYSAATASCPATIAWSQVNQTGAGGNFGTPWFVLARTS